MGAQNFIATMLEKPGHTSTMILHFVSRCIYSKSKEEMTVMINANDRHKHAINYTFEKSNVFLTKGDKCLSVCHPVCGDMAALSNMVSSEVNTIYKYSKLQHLSR